MKAQKITENTPLKDTEEKFVNFLLNDFKIGGKARAAIAAGYAPRSASITASRLLKKANIAARLAFLREESTVHMRITRERILKEYELIAFADPAAMYDERGNLLSVPDMPESMRRIVAGFEVEDRLEGVGENASVYYIKKVKMVDKKGALDSLAKFRDIFPAQKREHSGPGGGAMQVDATVKAQINLTVLPPGFSFPAAGKGKSA